jgi:voltage-gated potassium channel
MEMPLMLLAVAMIPLIVVPLVVELSPEWDQAILAADWFIWAVFTFEYLVRFVLSTEKWCFVRREWLALLIVLLPLLRPLRVVRSLRVLRLLYLLRLAAFASTIAVVGRRLLGRHRLHYVLVVTLLVVLGATVLVQSAEGGAGGSIGSFGDALWWAFATVTTVGYGDTVPVTPLGRGIAGLLMITGIAVFGVLTANVAHSSSNLLTRARLRRTTTPS